MGAVDRAAALAGDLCAGGIEEVGVLGAGVVPDVAALAPGEVGGAVRARAGVQRDPAAGAQRESREGRGEVRSFVVDLPAGQSRGRPAAVDELLCR